MTIPSIIRCPEAGCDLSPDHHDVDVTPEGTVVHHERLFGPISIVVDETIGRSDYAVSVYLDGEEIGRSEDPATALLALASGALQAAHYVASLVPTPDPPPA